MRLRVGEPELNKDRPFINDKLNRLQHAETLTQLFSNIEGPFVAVLNAPIGSGKTVFLRMFRQYLLNLGFPVIYFNARESDFQENPLIAFMGELNSAVEDLKKHGFETEKARKIFKKIKKTGKDILKKSISVAVKSSTYKIIDIEKGAEDAFSDFISSLFEHQINNYSSSKDLGKKFKENLKEFAEAAQKADHNPDLKPKPLVFLIDELDRCRPGHALSVIEYVSHYLEADGVVPVISADLEQLGHSVKTVFGQNTKDRSYLRKFIDFEYNLQLDNSAADLYCRYLSYETGISDIFNRYPDSEEALSELVYSGILMASAFSLSLNDLNVLFSSVHLVLLTMEGLRIETIAIIVILLSLKMRNLKLFNQIINKERTILYVINELNKSKKEITSAVQYDKFFIERRMVSLSLKRVSEDEYRNQIQSASMNSQNELSNIYKVLKDKNRMQQNDLMTAELLNQIRLLDPVKFHD